MGYAKRVDGTHAEIVKALRKVGCRVFDASRAGSGFPDLVVRVPTSAIIVVNGRGEGQYVSGKVLLLEVKTARGKLNAEQQVFLENWPETIVVRSVDEALAAVGVT